MVGDPRLAGTCLTPRRSLRMGTNMTPSRRCCWAPGPRLTAQLVSDPVGRIGSCPLSLHRPMVSGTSWHSGPGPQAPSSAGRDCPSSLLCNVQASSCPPHFDWKEVGTELADGPLPTFSPPSFGSYSPTYAGCTKVPNQQQQRGQKNSKRVMDSKTRCPEGQTGPSVQPGLHLRRGLSIWVVSLAQLQRPPFPEARASLRMPKTSGFEAGKDSSGISLVFL